MQEIIRVEQLSKSYQGRPAVNKLSFTLGQGKVLGLLGQEFLHLAITLKRYVFRKV